MLVRGVSVKLTPNGTLQTVGVGSGGPVSLWAATEDPLVFSQIPLIMSVLTVAMVVFTGVAWARRDWSLARRVYYTLATVASVAFIWFMNSWNLLGWRF